MRIPVCAVPLLAIAAGLSAGEAAHGTPPAKKDGVAQLQVPAGFTAKLWAEGSAVANPVAIACDEQDRLYLAQTFRFRIRGGLDIREHLALYGDDIRCKTLADRRALIAKWTAHFKPGYFTTSAERVSVVEPQADGTGATRIIADGFNDPLDGTAAGILVRDGTIHFACSPRVWTISGDGAKRSVHSEGWGVRFGISGHDLHGLVWGPDGRLYGSIGDRGFDVTTREGGKLSVSGRGAVFRSEADGSGMEIVYHGLRNPQELAFDTWGDLITVDNNADIGDLSRVVYCLEGGDSGWSAGWQMLANDGFAKAAGLGGRQPCAWLEEGLWKDRFTDQPAWVLPPVGFSTAGPCGLARIPETGWEASWHGRFLVCDYRAGTDSGVRSFGLETDGAGHRVVNEGKFIWGLGATDVAFANDGRLFVSNYLGGWALGERGRIYVLSHAAQATSAARATAALLAGGMSAHDDDALTRLLAHGDQRVRLSAQRALSARGPAGRIALALVAGNAGAPALARVHAIWGLGQQSAGDAQAFNVLLPLLGDRDARVREQAAKTLGDRRCAAAAPGLVTCLGDDSARVRCFAAIALGRLRHAPAVPALIALARSNADRDAFLRHGAVMGLAGCADPAALAACATDPAPAVRLAALLALRRLGDAGLERFLDDADQLIAAEAVRAVYDLPIPVARARLGRLLGKSWDTLGEPRARLITLRLIHAAARHGDVAAAAQLAAFAAGDSAPARLRAPALSGLAAWSDPGEIDPVLGLVRPATRRPRLDAAALKEPLLRLVARREQDTLPAAVALAQQLGFGLDEATLISLLDSPSYAASARAEALRQLVDKRSAGVAARLPKLLIDERIELRMAAFDALARLDPPAAVARAQSVLDGKVEATPGITAALARSVTSWDELPIGAPVAGGDLSGKRTVTWVEGFAKPSAKSGAEGQRLPRLTDGVLPDNEDDTARSTWFDGAEARLVLDLGASTQLARVNTYSWHKGDRAAQRFTLWASASATMPHAGASDLESGWVRLARVDSSGLGDGGRHGSSVFAQTGDLGRWRWLLWQCDSRPSGTFLSEIDVLPVGATLTALTQVAIDRSEAGWDELAMGAPAVITTGTTGAATATVDSAGATATWVEGFAKPSAKAGAEGAKLPRLTAAALAANEDDVSRNTWFDGGEARILLDLGRAIDVARVNTYSWHKNERAAQRFALWGADGAAPPDPAKPDLSGWTRIGRVDTSGLGGGGRHGSSIGVATGNLGRFRWLLWQTAAKPPAGTFYSRLDVYAQGRPLPVITPRATLTDLPLRQHLLAGLGTIPGEAAAGVLTTWLDRLDAGTVPPPLQLDVIEAATARSEPTVAERLRRRQAALPATDRLAAHRPTLFGGDATRGKEVFLYHAAQCQQCHSVGGEGGSAAPDLAGVGARLTRAGLLESLVDPGATVTPGYGIAAARLKDGREIAGFLLEKDDQKLIFRDADGVETSVPAADVVGFDPPVSPMPPMGELLKPRELRDLMAYLLTLR